MIFLIYSPRLGNLLGVTYVKITFNVTLKEMRHMLFNSLSFAVFLPIMFSLYWMIPHKFRWVLMLLASYWFYMSWNPKYVVLILFTSFVSYKAALIIEKQQEQRKKRLTLAAAAVLCLSVLFFFKYFNFFSESMTHVLRLFTIQLNPITLNLVLPVGISFYTFQTLSYVIDVYRGDITAEQHFGRYATFVSFFPQLVAGPIERTTNLLPQIKAEHKFSYDLATYGLKLMAWGYFKKIVIADTIAKYIGKVYENPHGYEGFALLLSAILFSVQIYCDFSGYSDIAIGTAKLFGINLMTNFKSPYFSQSVKEFWSRWHISLSTWFRDYVYIPLGGNRVTKIRHAFNLLLTFLVSGLWHGANWTFVVWGGIHGLAQVIENGTIPKKYGESKGLIWAFRVLVVFCFCTFAWIYFASSSLSDAHYIIAHMLDGVSRPIAYVLNGFTSVGIPKLNFVPIFLLFVYDYFSIKKDVITVVSSQKKVVRWCIYIVLAIWIILNIPAENTSEFIYFQF